MSMNPMQFAARFSAVLTCAALLLYGVWLWAEPPTQQCNVHGFCAKTAAEVHAWDKQHQGY